MEPQKDYDDTKDPLNVHGPIIFISCSKTNPFPNMTFEAFTQYVGDSSKVNTDIEV